MHRLRALPEGPVPAHYGVMARMSAAAFQFRPLPLSGLLLVETQRFEDPRGFFRMTWQESAFRDAGIPGPFVQSNLSHSMKDTLRGLHFQKPPSAQGKLLAVLSGEILDVAVDIRKGSRTFGKWESVTLSAANGRMLWVPEGFAHGFCVTSAEADVLYLVTKEYAPQTDRGVRWNDPALAIAWPTVSPLLSEKDCGLPLLAEADNPF